MLSRLLRYLPLALLFMPATAWAITCANPLTVTIQPGTTNVNQAFGTGQDANGACETGLIPYTGAIPAPVSFSNPLAMGQGLTTLTGAALAAGTTAGTTQVLSAASGAAALLVQLDQGAGISAGAVTFQATYDGSNWITVPAQDVINPATGALITLPYTLVPSTNQPFLLLTNGAQSVRLNVTTTTAGGSVTPYTATVWQPAQSYTYLTQGGNIATIKPASTAALATDPALVIGISPNSAQVFTLAQGSTTSGQQGSLVMGATTTNPVTSTNATTNPATLDLNSLLRVTNLMACNKVINIAQAATTDVHTFTGFGYICGGILVSATAQSIGLQEGTGTTCETGGTALIGVSAVATATPQVALAANGGFTIPGGLRTQVSGDHICVDQSSTGEVAGTIYYADLTN